MPLQGLTPGIRALLAVVVSPVVVLAQFYAVRVLGASFSAAILALVVANLLALILVYRRLRPWPRLDLVASVPYLMALAVPVGILMLFLQDPSANALRGHPFLHADLVHSLSNGFLKVEEAQLAGTTVGYPWGGHVMQAALSWIWGTSPVGNYRWTNLMWLFAGVLLLAQVTGAVGGGLRARVLTIIWALFAINAVGYTLSEFILPQALSNQYPVFGDFSYTPVLRKYSLWNQHPFGHGLFAGILYFLVRDDDVAFSKSATALVSVMAIGLAFIFPTFMPAVAVALFARLAFDVYRQRSNADVASIKRSVLSLGTIGVLGGAATITTLLVLGEDRAAGTGFALSSAWQLKTKSVGMLVVFAPFLVGSLISLRNKPRTPRSYLPVLVLGGILSLALYVVFALSHGIEYKLVFTTMMCLAPAAAIGFDKLLGGRGPVRAALYALLILFFVGTGAHSMISGRPTAPTPFPLRLSEFRSQLPEGHDLTASVAVIARSTPPNTVVVVDSVDFHLPVFTERSLYAPPHTNAIMYGVEMRNRFILGVNRGYGYEFVDQRLATTKQLFRSSVSAQRSEALEEIRRLGRPTAVLLELSRHTELLATLTENGAGKLLHRDPRWAVWLLDASQAVAHSSSPRRVRRLGA